MLDLLLSVMILVGVLLIKREITKKENLQVRLSGCYYYYFDSRGGGPAKHAYRDDVDHELLVNLSWSWYSQGYYY